MMPFSVATMNVFVFGYFAILPIIAVVEQTSSAKAIMSSRHSGWAITIESGKADLTLATFAPRKMSCVGHAPSYMTISFSGTCFLTQLPRFLSGVNRILSFFRLRTTETAFADVQQMSLSAFTSAVELT